MPCTPPFSRAFAHQAPKGIGTHQPNHISQKRADMLWYAPKTPCNVQKNPPSYQPPPPPFVRPVGYENLPKKPHFLLKNTPIQNSYQKTRILTKKTHHF